MHHLKNLPSRHPRRFLPPAFNAVRPADVLAEGTRLLAKIPGQPGELADWLAGRLELERAIKEARLLAKLDFYDQPGDPMRRLWLDGFQQDLVPAWLELRHRLDLALLAAPALDGLPSERRERLLEPLLRRESLYMETNLILLQRLAEIENEAIAVLGGLPNPAVSGEASPALEDAAARREAWRARLDAAAELQDILDDLIDELHAVREQIARNCELNDWSAFEAAKHGESVDADGRRACLDRCARELAADARTAPGRVTGPWDLLGTAGAVQGGCDAGSQVLLDRLLAGFDGIDGELAEALGEMRASGRLLLEGGAGRVAFSGCLWLPEHGLPVLHLSGLGAHQDLAVLLRLFATAMLGRARERGQEIETADARTMLPVEALAVAAAEAWVEELGPLCGGDPAQVAAERRRGALREIAGLALRLEWEENLHALPGLDRTERAESWLRLRREQAAFDLSAEDEARLGREILLDPMIYSTDWRRACRWSALEAGAALAGTPAHELGAAIRDGLRSLATERD